MTGQASRGATARRAEEAEILDAGTGEAPEALHEGALDDHDPHHGDDPGGDDAGEPAESGVDWQVVQACSRLDHSDTDNAERLIRHFGRDLTVLAQDGVSGGDWLGWAGTHWDLAGGKARVELIGQKLGSRIALEAHLLGKPTPEEKAILDEGEAARERIRAATKDDGAAPGDKLAVARAEALDAKIKKRRDSRRAFAVTSKNHGRIEKALACAAPRLRRPPESFNADRYRFATRSHTISLVRELDLDCPDPDVERWKARVDAFEGHRREDLLTSVLPIAWEGRKAPAPKWRAFVAQMLTDPEKRRTVQQFAGTGLLAIAPQFVMFHYGSGANGKSVFLETLTRVMGPSLAVGLPRESLVGGSERSSGSASPDIVRLFGKRMVRILEVPGDVPLQEDLIKRLTGGEALPVRNLFKGYFEFQNVASPHMSGNGLPTISGTDNGIWRRMLLVHWDQVVPEDDRRDFEEMVSGFVREEGAGILAWLVEGALDYLANGLFVAPSVKASTEGYRADMDPIGEFRKACVVAKPGSRVQSRTMYEAYKSWSMANAMRVRSETKFSRTMKQALGETQIISGRNYFVDVDLQNVPDRPEDGADPGPEPMW